MSVFGDRPYKEEMRFELGYGQGEGGTIWSGRISVLTRKRLQRTSSLSPCAHSKMAVIYHSREEASE